MDIPKYFSNVVLAQFKATGIPLKVYVNDQYLIIPDMYEISDPLIGSGMTPAGDMIQFDYREIDHLLVGCNVIDLATYTKAMTGDTPEEDAKENEAEDEAAETTEESLELGEITKDVLKARQKALDAEEDALKDKQKALKDEPITEDGLWANIHAKRKRGEKPAPKGSKAYKAAKKAGDKINNESVNEEVDRPEEKKTAILNAIAKEEKRSEFQNRILNQIKRAIVDGEPLFKLPFKTQADYRKLMKMYKIPFSSKKAEKGNLRAESVITEAKMPNKFIGNDEIVYLKTKETSRGAHYNLYYKGHDIDKGGHSFGSEKELEDFAGNYILSNQWYNKLKYEDSIPLPESVIKKGSYVTNKDGLVGRVDNISGDKEIADIRYNDDTEDSLPIKNLKIFEKSMNEAWIGPFVFGNTTKDDELKAMYNGALDGYANWKNGMVHPRADYKKAYQTIEKLLKRRGIQVESIKEDHAPIDSISEPYMFQVGDFIKNTNTSCDHFGSMGIIQKMFKLADKMIVKYRVVNNGDTFKPGDVLSKTSDQLDPIG